MAIDTAHEDPRITTAREALIAIPLERIERVRFNRETIYVDGREFIDCTFVNCRLVTRTGHFKLHGQQSYGLPLAAVFEDPLFYAVEWRAWLDANVPGLVKPNVAPPTTRPKRPGRGGNGHAR